MSSDVIFVVGPGRCGTSTTARILHTHFGICMGRNFMPADSKSPLGCWEDLDFVGLNQAAVASGWIVLHDWAQRVMAVIRDREATGKPWGVKDPRFCYVLPWYLAFVPRAKVVRCTRYSAQVIDSFINRMGWDPKAARQECRRREVLLDAAIGGAEDLVLDFSERRTDEEVIESLSAIVSAVPEGAEACPA